MQRFRNDQRSLVQKAIADFREWFSFNVKKYFELASLKGRKEPSDWAQLSEALDKLNEQSGSYIDEPEFEGFEIHEDALPLLKRVLIVQRREQAKRIQLLQDKTHHLEVLGALDQELEPFDKLTSSQWFRGTDPYRLPQVTDFLPTQSVEDFPANQSTLKPRKFDEKFHILQAPELFLPDLDYYRTLTDLRNTATTVAFVDIDDFKTFNTDYTETKVDRNVLPRFMQLLEAHVKFHGHAYRQGGDEYLATLPGFTRKFALDFLDDLRTKISTLTYPEIQRSATVSIGACTADPDCYLTNRELQEMANRAKEYAKRETKNKIASYRGNSFTSEDLHIERPEPRQVELL